MRSFSYHLLAPVGVFCAFIIFSCLYIGAAVAGTGTPTEASVEQPSQTPCIPGWQFVSGPNPDADKSYLKAVAALSTSDAWAVGYSVTGNTAETLIEHWDGTQWTIVPSPNASGPGNILSGITVIATDNA